MQFDGITPLAERPTQLVFQSPVVRLRLLEDAEPFSTSLDNWGISETFEPGRFRHEREYYGAYQLLLRHSLQATEDPGNAYIYGCFLARSLDRICTYSTGLPLSARGYDLFLTPTNPPPEWKSNAAEIIPGPDWSLLQNRISYGPFYRTMPRFPLKASVEALLALAQSDELVAQLCSYHLEALSTTEQDLHLLLLAQGLEIAKELLPGNSASGKQKKLPDAVSVRCHKTLSWLFGMAQQRRETRHSIDKRGVLTLKPPFAIEEEDDFLHDANLVIQHVVSQQLKIPLVINDNGRAVEVERAISPSLVRTTLPADSSPPPDRSDEDVQRER